ncbi:hypothetical protein XELAEV_18028506mg [Xenopus laevis]|uniref:Uncharacterized protein n=1 Tax=Xenopus laevis TaxID=8355 RepID=A0A974CRQ7_XENLA|nr:hypothetical protein XELAEV_18028506mg [Xenopus laevis]
MHNAMSIYHDKSLFNTNGAQESQDFLFFQEEFGFPPCFSPSPQVKSFLAAGL